MEGTSQLAAPKHKSWAARPVWGGPHWDCLAARDRRHLGIV